MLVSGLVIHRRRPIAAGLLVCAALVLLGTVARGATVQRVRWFSAPDHTRVVLDLDGPADYEVRRVTGPERLAVNVAGFRFSGAEAVMVEDGLVRRIRSNQGRTRAQLVLDLDRAARFRHFRLRAADGRPDRIVVDVFREHRAAPEPAPDEAPAPTFKVIVDPGHGGLDPGAIRGRVQEKDIVLDVSRRLRDILTALPGCDVAMTRDRDWYPSLADRVRTASDEDGDLFVSIHCNTHRRASVRGMEVYFLSLQGASDREAQELADKENAADLVGLAPGAPASDTVLSILMDLHMTRVLRRSSRPSDCVLSAAADDGLPVRRVKQAGFQVLRSLAMPSALVELAYMSNAEDQRLMNDEAGRQRLAEAIAVGIQAYRHDADVVAVRGDAPRWGRHYKVRRGDNLWRLARSHDTTVAEIRRHNNLRTDRIRTGQYLSLPEGRPEP